MPNLKEIEKRTICAAEKVLFLQQYVRPIDIFLGMGLLQEIQVQEWKKGKIPYLEKAIQGNLHKISHTMKCFRKWLNKKG